MLVFLLLLANEVYSHGTREPYPNQNWTSCREFLNNSQFDPDTVIDVDWKIFYFWNPNMEESYNIKFSKPSKVLVDRFRVELENELQPPVNWSDAVLFMETTIDYSALFFRTNNSGVFRMVPSTAFHYTSIPVLIFAMKVVEPGYLGIANCKHRLCYALASVDKMPLHTELEKEARKLGFYSTFNRSFVEFPAHSTKLPPYASPKHDLEDEDHDEDLEMELDPDKLQIF